MHADEVDIGVPLVRRLLTAQFRQWADLSLERVDSTGTSNASIGWAMTWSCDCLESSGPPWRCRRSRSGCRALLRIYHSPFLSRSVWARQRRDIRGPGRSTGGSRARTRPSSGLPMKVRQRRRWPPSCWRCSGSIPRADHRPARTTTAAAHRWRRGDEQTRDAIATLAGVLDTDLINAAWEEALGASTWTAPPVWIHGDLLPGNLLVKDGRLCAVIDFGGLGVGDPACDSARRVELVVRRKPRRVPRRVVRRWFDVGAWARLGVIGRAASRCRTTRAPTRCSRLLPHGSSRKSSPITESV